MADMKLDEFSAAILDMLKRGVDPQTLRVELEFAIRLHLRLQNHKHNWKPVQIEHFKCECGAETFGMMVDNG